MMAANPFYEAQGGKLDFDRHNPDGVMGRALCKDQVCSEYTRKVDEDVVNICKLLLDNGTPANATNKSGQTALFLLLRNCNHIWRLNRISYFSLTLSNSPRQIVKRDRVDRSHHAYGLANTLAMLRLLCEAGADVNWPDSPTTPLQAVVTTLKTGVETLQQITCSGDLDFSPYVVFDCDVMVNAYVDIIQELFDRGADPNTHCKKFGLAPLNTLLEAVLCPKQTRRLGYQTIISYPIMPPSGIANMLKLFTVLLRNGAQLYPEHLVTDDVALSHVVTDQGHPPLAFVLSKLHLFLPNSTSGGMAFGSCLETICALTRLLLHWNAREEIKHEGQELAIYLGTLLAFAATAHDLYSLRHCFWSLLTSVGALVSPVTFRQSSGTAAYSVLQSSLLRESQTDERKSCLQSVCEYVQGRAGQPRELRELCRVALYRSTPSVAKVTSQLNVPPIIKQYLLEIGELEMHSSH